MRDIEQQFLNELDAQLWKAADKLRSHLDAANYKHVVLGLIFLKYVSDAFEELAGDVRWTINTNGQKRILTPPEGNANFVWMLHMLYHLAPTGSMALLLANGSMSRGRFEEDDGIPFADKMATLTSKLKAKFEENDKLKGEIRKNLAGLGFYV